MDENFWTRIYACHHDLVFSNSILSVALNESRGISASRPSLSPCNYFLWYLSNRLFCYVLSGPIFYSKIVFLLLYTVVGLSSCILHQLVDRIFFRFLGISCFVCIVCPIIFWVFLYSPISFDLSLQVHFQTCPLFYFDLFIPTYSSRFSSLSAFICCHSPSNFPTRFCISVQVP